MSASPDDESYERGMRCAARCSATRTWMPPSQRTTDFTADFQELDHPLRLGRHLGAARASTAARAAASR